jgi:parallel beta-helix repeat protein
MTSRAAIWKARLMLLGGISVTLLCASPAKTQTASITTIPGTAVCPVTITSPGTYVLGGSVGPCINSDGIDIQASAVSLNLNGFTITGTCNSPYSGISIFGTTTLTNILIEGPGTIDQFSTGVSALSDSSSAHSVTVNLCTLTGSVGFQIGSRCKVCPISSRWKLDSNVVTGFNTANGGDGVSLSGVQDSDVISNNISFTGPATGFPTSGIVLCSSSRNIVLSNTVTGTTNDGIDTGDCTGSDDNHIALNTTSNNSVGILVGLGDTGNHIRGNTSMGNTMFDLEDDNPGCDTNKWVRNTFITANQTCIH